MTLELDFHDKLLLNYIVGNILGNIEKDEDDEFNEYSSSPAFSFNETEYETLKEIAKKL